jgi:hypothetical protein
MTDGDGHRPVLYFVNGTHKLCISKHHTSQSNKKMNNKTKITSLYWEARFINSESDNSAFLRFIFFVWEAVRNG